MTTSPHPDDARESTAHQPTPQEILSLHLPTSVAISADGQWTALLVRTTNWRENRYETICQVVRNQAGAEPMPLTRSGNVRQVEWVKNHDLALLKEGAEVDAKAQIWLYEKLIGEGWPVTDHELGVGWFSSFAQGILFQANNPQRHKKEERTRHFGDYVHVEQETSASALYYCDFTVRQRWLEWSKAHLQTDGAPERSPLLELSALLPDPLFIQQVAPAPTGDTLYLTCWPRDDRVYRRQTRHFCITLAPATELAKVLSKTDSATPDLTAVAQIQELFLPPGSSIRYVSPDGLQLLIAHQGRDNLGFTRQDLWIISRQALLQAASAEQSLVAMVNLTASLDRQFTSVDWAAAGIFVTYPDGCLTCASHLTPEGGVTHLDLGDLCPTAPLAVSDDGTLAFVGTNAAAYPEVYSLHPAQANRPLLLTHFGQALAHWQLGTVETIRWTSRDGTEIEGVLRKPANFDPDCTYPLLFVVHGGPTSLSPAYLMAYDDLYYYPTVPFVNREMLVLKPNYRGSIGRGQAFMELNVNNLGVGDLWDLESAIDHLQALGWVDPQRVGCMGWSQGGYISAFAGLHSERFQAVSVGAGISDWYTYHISNDIPDFTTDWLSGSPFRDRTLYEKTAPISNLERAHTPMLIQHGAEDKRVPLSNAMELYRGLQEMGVPVELFVFPGMGHPITKPRQNHAVMHQNLAWFAHYLLGDELRLEEVGSPIAEK